MTDSPFIGKITGEFFVNSLRVFKGLFDEEFPEVFLTVDENGWVLYKYNIKMYYVTIKIPREEWEEYNFTADQPIKMLFAIDKLASLAKAVGVKLPMVITFSEMVEAAVWVDGTITKKMRPSSTELTPQDPPTLSDSIDVYFSISEIELMSRPKKAEKHGWMRLVLSFDRTASRFNVVHSLELDTGKSEEKPIELTNLHYDDTHNLPSTVALMDNQTFFRIMKIAPKKTWGNYCIALSTDHGAKFIYVEKFESHKMFVSIITPPSTYGDFLDDKQKVSFEMVFALNLLPVEGEDRDYGVIDTKFLKLIDNTIVSEDILIIVQNSGWDARHVDPAHVYMGYFAIPEYIWIEYKFDHRDEPISFNWKKLMDDLKTVKSAKTFKIRISEYLMTLGSVPHLPETKFPVAFTVSSSVIDDIERVFKLAGEICDAVDIMAVEEGVYFGAFGSAHDPGNPEATDTSIFIPKDMMVDFTLSYEGTKAAYTQIGSNNVVISTFSYDYFAWIIKSLRECVSATFQFNNKWPIIVKSEFYGVYFVIALAPRVDNDEASDTPARAYAKAVEISSQITAAGWSKRGKKKVPVASGRKGIEEKEYLPWYSLKDVWPRKAKEPVAKEEIEEEPTAGPEMAITIPQPPVSPPPAVPPPKITPDDDRFPPPEWVWPQPWPDIDPSGRNVDRNWREGITKFEVIDRDFWDPLLKEALGHELEGVEGTGFHNYILVPRDEFKFIETEIFKRDYRQPPFGIREFNILAGAKVEFLVDGGSKNHAEKAIKKTLKRPPMVNYGRISLFDHEWQAVRHLFTFGATLARSKGWSVPPPPNFDPEKYAKKKVDEQEKIDKRVKDLMDKVLEIPEEKNLPREEYEMRIIETGVLYDYPEKHPYWELKKIDKKNLGGWTAIEMSKELVKKSDILEAESEKEPLTKEERKKLARTFPYPKWVWPTYWPRNHESSHWTDPKTDIDGNIIFNLPNETFWASHLSKALGRHITSMSGERFLVSPEEWDFIRKDIFRDVTGTIPIRVPSIELKDDEVIITVWGDDKELTTKELDKKIKGKYRFIWSSNFAIPIKLWDQVQDLFTATSMLHLEVPNLEIPNPPRYTGKPAGDIQPVHTGLDIDVFSWVDLVKHQFRGKTPEYVKSYISSAAMRKTDSPSILRLRGVAEAQKGGWTYAKIADELLKPYPLIKDDDLKEIERLREIYYSVFNIAQAPTKRIKSDQFTWGNLDYICTADGQVIGIGMGAPTMTYHSPGTWVNYHSNEKQYDPPNWNNIPGYINRAYIQALKRGIEHFQKTKTISKPAPPPTKPPPPKITPATVSPPPSKQDWEMTLMDYGRYKSWPTASLERIEKKGVMSAGWIKDIETSSSMVLPAFVKREAREHYQTVYDAVKKGLPVPPEVIAIYPDISGKPSRPPLWQKPAEAPPITPPIVVQPRAEGFKPGDIVTDTTGYNTIARVTRPVISSQTGQMMTLELVTAGGGLTMIHPQRLRYANVSDIEEKINLVKEAFKGTPFKDEMKKVLLDLDQWKAEILKLPVVTPPVLPRAAPPLARPPAPAPIARPPTPSPRAAPPSPPSIPRPPAPVIKPTAPPAKTPPLKFAPEKPFDIVVRTFLYNWKLNATKSPEFKYLPGFKHGVWVIPVRDEATGDTFRIVAGFPAGERDAYKLYTMKNKGGRVVSMMIPKDETEIPDIKDVPAAAVQRAFDEARKMVSPPPSTLAAAPNIWDEMSQARLKLYQDLDLLTGSAEIEDLVAGYRQTIMAMNRVNVAVDILTSSNPEILVTRTKQIEKPPRPLSMSDKAFWEDFARDLTDAGINPENHREAFEEAVLSGLDMTEKSEFVRLKALEIVASQQITPTLNINGIKQAALTMNKQLKFSWRAVPHAITTIEFDVNVLADYIRQRQVSGTHITLLKIGKTLSNLKKFFEKHKDIGSIVGD